MFMIRSFSKFIVRQKKISSVSWETGINFRTSGQEMTRTEGRKSIRRRQRKEEVGDSLDKDINKEGKIKLRRRLRTEDDKKPGETSKEDKDSDFEKWQQRMALSSKLEEEYQSETKEIGYVDWAVKQIENKTKNRNSTTKYEIEPLNVDIVEHVTTEETKPRIEFSEWEKQQKILEQQEIEWIIKENPNRIDLNLIIGAGSSIGLEEPEKGAAHKIGRLSQEKRHLERILNNDIQTLERIDERSEASDNESLNLNEQTKKVNFKDFKEWEQTQMEKNKIKIFQAKRQMKKIKEEETGKSNEERLKMLIEIKNTKKQGELKNKKKMRIKGDKSSDKGEKEEEIKEPLLQGNQVMASPDINQEHKDRSFRGYQEDNNTDFHIKKTERPFSRRITDRESTSVYQQNILTTLYQKPKTPKKNDRKEKTDLYKSIKSDTVLYAPKIEIRKPDGLKSKNESKYCRIKPNKIRLNMNIKRNYSTKIEEEEGKLVEESRSLLFESAYEFYPVIERNSIFNSLNSTKPAIRNEEEPSTSTRHICKDNVSEKLEINEDLEIPERSIIIGFREFLENMKKQLKSRRSQTKSIGLQTDSVMTLERKSNVQEYKKCKTFLNSEKICSSETEQTDFSEKTLKDVPVCQAPKPSLADIVEMTGNKNSTLDFSLSLQETMNTSFDDTNSCFQEIKTFLDGPRTPCLKEDTCCYSTNKCDNETDTDFYDTNTDFYDTNTTFQETYSLNTTASSDDSKTSLYKRNKLTYSKTSPNNNEYNNIIETVEKNIQMLKKKIEETRRNRLMKAANIKKQFYFNSDYSEMKLSQPVSRNISTTSTGQVKEVCENCRHNVSVEKLPNDEVDDEIWNNSLHPSTLSCSTSSNQPIIPINISKTLSSQKKSREKCSFNKDDVVLSRKINKVNQRKPELILNKNTLYSKIITTSPVSTRRVSTVELDQKRKPRQRDRYDVRYSNCQQLYMRTQKDTPKPVKLEKSDPFITNCQTLMMRTRKDLAPKALNDPNISNCQSLNIRTQKDLSATITSQGQNGLEFCDIQRKEIADVNPSSSTLRVRPCFDASEVKPLKMQQDDDIPHMIPKCNIRPCNAVMCPPIQTELEEPEPVASQEKGFINMFRSARKSVVNLTCTMTTSMTSLFSPLVDKLRRKEEVIHQKTDHKENTFQSSQQQNN